MLYLQTRHNFRGSSPTPLPLPHVVATGAQRTAALPFRAYTRRLLHLNPSIPKSFKFDIYYSFILFVSSFLVLVLVLVLVASCSSLLPSCFLLFLLPFPTHTFCLPFVHVLFACTGLVGLFCLPHTCRWFSIVPAPNIYYPWFSISSVVVVCLPILLLSHPTTTTTACHTTYLPFTSTILLSLLLCSLPCVALPRLFTCLSLYFVGTLCVLHFCARCAAHYATLAALPRAPLATCCSLFCVFGFGL